MPRRWPCGSSRRSWDRHRPAGPRLFLGESGEPSRKKISAWALEADFDATHVVSNTFELEWPPRSGKIQEFPEVDKAAWWTIDEARTKLHKAQVPLLDALAEVLENGDAVRAANRSTPAQQARSAIGAGEHTGPTAHLAPGCVQANLVVLPKAAAEDFITFAERNPKTVPHRGSHRTRHRGS